MSFVFFDTGVVLSVCYISRQQASFRFRTIRLGRRSRGREPTIDDIFEIDDEFQTVVTSIQGIKKEVFNKGKWAASLPLPV
jgi:hypothetical protein